MVKPHCFGPCNAMFTRSPISLKTLIMTKQVVKPLQTAPVCFIKAEKLILFIQNYVNHDNFIFVDI